MALKSEPATLHEVTVREEILAGARACVLQDRNRAYGGPEDSFSLIAGFWTVYLGQEVTAVQVAHMMALMKMARLTANPTHMDSYIDLAGYAACGAEVASASINPTETE